MCSFGFNVICSNEVLDYKILFQAKFLVSNKSSWEFCQCKEDRINLFFNCVPS